MDQQHAPYGGPVKLLPICFAVIQPILGPNFYEMVAQIIMAPPPHLNAFFGLVLMYSYASLHIQNVSASLYRVIEFCG